MSVLRPLLLPTSRRPPWPSRRFMAWGCPGRSAPGAAMPGLTVPARVRDLLQVNIVCSDGHVTNIGIIQHLDFYLPGQRREHLDEADLLIPLGLSGVGLHRRFPLGRRRCESHAVPAGGQSKGCLRASLRMACPPVSPADGAGQALEVAVSLLLPRSSNCSLCFIKGGCSKALAVPCTAKGNTGSKWAAPPGPEVSQGPLGTPPGPPGCPGTDSLLSGYHRTRNPGLGCKKRAISSVNSPKGLRLSPACYTGLLLQD